MKRGLPCNVYRCSTLRMFIANSHLFGTNALHPACSVCLSLDCFRKRSTFCSGPVTKKSLMCLPVFLLGVCSKWFKSVEKATVVPCFVPYPWNSREHSHCVCPMPSTHPRVQGCQRSSGGGSIHTLLSVPSGFKGVWCKAPRQSPTTATCPFGTALATIILNCIIAGVAVPAHASSTCPSSLRHRALCPPNVLQRVWWLRRCVARL